MVNSDTLLKSRKVWVSLVLGIALCMLIGFWRTSPIVYIVLPALIFAVIAFAREKGLVRITAIDIAMLMLVLFELISFLSSSYHANSVPYFVKVTTLVAFYFIAVTINNRVRSITWILTFVALYGGLLSLGTVIQYVQFHMNAVAHGFDEIYQFKSNFAPYGIAINDWGSVLLLFFVSAVVCLVERWENEYFRNALIACVILLCWALIITFSRGIYISMLVFATMIGTGIIIVLKSSLKKVIRITAVAATFCLVSVIPVANSFVSTAMMTKTTSQVRSLNGRVDTIKKSLPLIFEHPLLGVGSSNFAIHYPGNYVDRAEDVNEIMFRPNNTAAHLLVEKGIIGAAVYGILILILLIELWRETFRQKGSPQAALLLIIFSGLIVFLLKEITFSSLLVSDSVLMLLVVWVIVIRSRCSSLISVEYKFKPVARWSVALGALVLVVGVLFEHVALSRGEASNSRAILAMREHNPALALFEIDVAISFRPGHAVYHLNKALILASEHAAPFNAVDLLSGSRITFSPDGTWQAPERDFKAAMALVPSDPLPAIHLGWIRLYEGDTASAHKYFIMACRTDPWEPLSNLSLALLGVHSGRDDEAINGFANCIRAVPGVLESELWRTMTRSHRNIVSSVLSVLLGDFRRDVEANGNPILQARLAKILLTTGHNSDSKRLLSHISTEMPNLNRPWAYLADSALERDEHLQEQLLKKAEFVDQTDYLPKLRLGMLYEKRQQYERAILYYRKAVPLMLSMSLGPASARIHYYYNSSTITERFMPNDLILSALPDSDPRMVCDKLSGMYKEVGSIEISDRLKKLATGRPLSATDVGWLLL